jgi:hypothetical protein
MDWLQNVIVKYMTDEGCFKIGMGEELACAIRKEIERAGEKYITQLAGETPWDNKIEAVQGFLKRLGI